MADIIIKQKQNLQPAYSAHILCLTVDKQVLDERIDKRVDKMMEVSEGEGEVWELPVFLYVQGEGEGRERERERETERHDEEKRESKG
jgi:hypothetical protein